MNVTLFSDDKRYKALIVDDDNPENPRELSDHYSRMVCFHRRYLLGDKHGYRYEDYSGWDDLQNHLVTEEDAIVILPLYLYDHSGLRINVTGYSDRWDSGRVGFIYATRKDVVREYGNDSPETLLKVQDYLKAEVEAYDSYLSGDVYGCLVYEADKEQFNSPELLLKDLEPEPLRYPVITDTCWGFYGSDWKTNGILYHLKGFSKEWHEAGDIR